jgi:dTDP-4-dehydrorhamnose reductase
MKKLLLIGSTGLLGSSLHRKLKNKFNITTVTRSTPGSDYNVDLSSKDKSYELFDKINPDFIVNLAAITNVDQCESDINLAYLVNTRIAENIACYSNSKNSLFIVHISTDHIYNQSGSNEEDVVILNSYAMTKYCAEKSFSKNNAVVLRTNFFGKSLSSKSEGLCDSIYKSVHTGNEIKLFNDVFFSPLSIDSLGNVILVCLEKKIPGIYNVGSKGGMSKEKFLKKFLELSGVSDFKYKSISIDEINLMTPRPKDMRMNVDLFEKTYNYSLPRLINEIKDVANEFK